MSEFRTYDLLCEPWIPVIWRTDAAEPKEPNIGIREALTRAAEIKCVAHTSPLIEFGLYRLLIAIVLDAYIVADRRPTIGRIKATREAGHFDACILRKYFEEHQDGFDLWGGEHPFLQMAAVNGKSEGVSKMIAPVPSGTKIAFWHHYTENETDLTEKEAARELCAVAPFCFDNAPKDICTLGGDPPLYVLVLGDRLFDTIIYNLPRPSGRVTVRQEHECGPAWRCPVVDAAAIPRVPTLTQGWTWPVRQIRLCPSDVSSAISNAVNKAGSEKTASRQKVKGWRDPNAGTVTDAKGIRHIRASDLIPKFARTGGQGDQNPLVFWRDLVPLFLIASEGEALRGDQIRSRPEVVTNALRVTEDKLLRLAAYGFVDKGGKNNKVFRTWFRTILSLPTELACDTRLSARAMSAFKTTQKIADALQTALRMLRPPVKAGKGRRPAPSREEAGVLAEFWQGLELVLGRRYLDVLTRQESNAEAELWEKVRKEARGAFARGIDPHRRTADGVFRSANASNWFETRLAWLIPVRR